MMAGFTKTNIQGLSWSVQRSSDRALVIVQNRLVKPVYHHTVGRGVIRWGSEQTSTYPKSTRLQFTEVKSSVDQLRPAVVDWVCSWCGLTCPGTLSVVSGQ